MGSQTRTQSRWTLVLPWSGRHAGIHIGSGGGDTGNGGGGRNILTDEQGRPLITPSSAKAPDRITDYIHPRQR
ncbi:MAG TPA: hypothetical protein QF626_05170 [Prochlorococcaceae cyanobacterium Fu_MAG_50]|nr:hypothetical protein [Prochlorococcaceae cyanobacterium Fu_MAG_50]